MQTMEEDGLCWDPVFSNQASLSFSWQASRNGPDKIGGQADTRCRAKGDKGAEWQAWQANMSKVRLDISTLTRLSFKYKWTIPTSLHWQYHLNQTHPNQITKHPKQLLQTNLYENFFPRYICSIPDGPHVFGLCTTFFKLYGCLSPEFSDTLEALGNNWEYPSFSNKALTSHTQWHGTWGLSMLNSVHLVYTCSKCLLVEISLNMVGYR